MLLIYLAVALLWQGFCHGDPGFDPDQRLDVSSTPAPFSCFVGYQFNNSAVVGGSVPCDGGQCVLAKIVLSGISTNIFACEPMGICNAIVASGNLTFVDATCCNNASNCNALGFTTPAPPTAPTHVTPTLCYEGLFINNAPVMSRETPTVCYGDCAGFNFNYKSGTTGNNVTISLLTCDPVSLCHSLDLENSCHSLPKGILSGCCCNSNLCIDPANGVKPTPAMPPPNAIKCPAGLQITDTAAGATPTSAVTSVDCMGMCHTTSLRTSDNKTYNVYSCDDFGVCDMLNVRPNSCNNGDMLRSCCCDTNYCNVDNVNALIPADPFPPNRAERCFSGFALGAFGGVPLGRSEYCRGDCVTYKLLNANITIYGCDPVQICQTLNAENNCINDDNLQVCCCTTSDCNFAPDWTHTMNCVNGISVNYGNALLVKGTSSPCVGSCANFSASVGSIDVTVFTCDMFNLCQIPDTGVMLTTECCQTDNCNIGDISALKAPDTSNKTRTINCFEGIDIGRSGAVGFHVPCNGSCGRVHLGSDTFYLCDPGDVCKSFGINGCNILADGLSVCCCNGDYCNDKDAMIPPARVRDLTCLAGYTIGNTTVGATQRCDGMCGTIMTSIGTINATAHVCLDFDLCVGLDLYEECRNLAFDQQIRGCCCQSHMCNYKGSMMFPTPPTIHERITCPEGVWIGGRSDYDSNHVVSCQGDCGSVSFATTIAGHNASVTYFGCDPAGFCQSMNVSNSCGSLTTAMSVCCCDTPMCLDPLAHKYQPPSLPPAAAVMNCFVGYGFNDAPLVGGTVTCSGSCLRAIGMLGTYTLGIYACEPLGICDLMASSVPGFAVDCCDDRDNCNTRGHVVPSPAPTTVPPKAVLCYEGVFYNNFALMSKDTPTVCYGDCSSVSLTLASNNTFTMYTCDPATLCKSLSMSNSCNQISGGVFSGCCCDSNMCLDPLKGVTVPVGPPPNNNSTQQCFVGYNFNNGSLTGGDTTCPGNCMKATASLGGILLNIYACEAAGICTMTGPSPLTGVNFTCCSGSDNCNIDHGLVVPTPDPSIPTAAAILCYEGVYLNGKPLSGRDDPVVCRGDCAKLGVKLGSVSYQVYTCDPASLCSNFGLSNNCQKIFDGTFVACCCNSHMCLDPLNNVTEPNPNPHTEQCFVGYNFNNGALVGGSTTCPGSCLKVSGTLGSTTLNIYACEPSQVCDLASTLNLTYVKLKCCSGSDNCNVDAGAVIPTPNPNAPVPPTIVCYEGVFLNGKALSTREFPVTCQGQCASVGVTVGSFSYDVFTCDPSQLCQTLGINNNCAGVVNNTFHGCCCGWNMCLDPLNGVVVPATTPAPVVITTPAATTKCFIGYNFNNGSLTGGTTTCPGDCIKASGTLGTITLNLYACEPASVCALTSNITSNIVKIKCCSGTDNCNVDPGAVIPTPDPNAPVSPSILCYEGVFLNGSSIGHRDDPVICQGQCASVGVKIGTFSYSIYTCDPSQLCQSLGINNNCAGVVNNSFSGCCCNSNMCLDPINNVTVPSKPTTTRENCFIGYNFNNGSLVGGSTTCPGSCLKASGTVGTTTLNLYACEPSNVCDIASNYNLTYVKLKCCSGKDNCNVDPGAVIPTPDPNAPVSPSILCYEGVFLNGKALSTRDDPVVCQGQCASVGVKVGTFSYSVYTCDPSQLCQSLGINNNCVGVANNLFSGCCCGSNMCLDPMKNVTTPANPSKTENCFIGYSFNNGSLVGGSTTCPGSCLRASGTLPSSNTTTNATTSVVLNVYSCEPSDVCSLTLSHPIPGINFSCCAGKDNCNVLPGAVIPPPAPNATQPPSILCYEGVYVNNVSLSARDDPVVCQGQCASAGVTLGNFSYVVYTCDPQALCQSLGINNNCKNVANNTFNGCCCNSNMCLDPIKGVAVPATTPAIPTTTKSASAITLSLGFLLSAILLNF